MFFDAMIISTFIYVHTLFIFKLARLSYKYEGNGKGFCCLKQLQLERKF